MNTAKEDWKNLMTNLHNRETGLQVRAFNASPKWFKTELLFLSRPGPNSVIISCCVLQNLVSQMEDFEACAEPLQDCLNATEHAVQESSMRLHDLTGKKMELHKLQVLILPTALIMLIAPHIYMSGPLNGGVPPSLFLSFSKITKLAKCLPIFYITGIFLLLFSSCSLNNVCCIGQ